MKQNLRIAVLMTLVTTVLFGLVYPLAVTGLGQLIFPTQANGGIIGQPFSSPSYFHPRPSGAGNGYDATSSGSANLGPTNHQLMDRVKADVEKLHAENPSAEIPVDLVTSSGSGLDPHISPAAAEFQVPRIARERGISEAEVRALVAQHALGRQFGVLGEPRVNVLELNLALDAAHPKR
jgi:K+-transporting ATPase ATPase C chain